MMTIFALYSRVVPYHFRGLDSAYLWVREWRGSYSTILSFDMGMIVKVFLLLARDPQSVTKLGSFVLPAWMKAGEVETSDVILIM
jgi:hypothetical protein